MSSPELLVGLLIALGLALSWAGIECKGHSCCNRVIEEPDEADEDDDELDGWELKQANLAEDADYRNDCIAEEGIYNDEGTV